MARLLETSLSSDALSSRLARGQAGNLRQAFADLPIGDQERIRQAWGFATEEVLSLGGDCDRELRDQALLQIAGRLENLDRLAPAAAIYSTISSGNDAVASRARARLDAMNGVGMTGARVEFLARRFFHEACRPEMLIGMGAAGLTFRMTRLAAGARLAGSLESAWQIRTAATGAGFLAETVAFTGATKVAGAAFGVPQDWSAPAVGREWASGALALLGLKTMGGLSSAALRRWVRGSGAFDVFSRTALPQAAMLGGIMIGHRLEAAAGLREHRDGGTDLVDSLVLLAHFNIAGRILHGVSGPGGRRFEAALEAQTQAIHSARRSRLSAELWPSILGGPRWVQANGPGLAMIGNGGESRPEPMRNEGSSEALAERPEAPSNGHNHGSNGVEAEAAAAPSTLPPAGPKTLPPPAFDPQTARYHLPNTKYFQELRGDLSFDALVGYARAVERARLIGVNLRTTLQVPMVGPEEYSPYGAALVEHLRENPALVHSLTGKNERALIASPGTAILGLGAAGVGPDLILQAEAADAIMQGKAKYFLLTAGVSATPLCVRSHFSPEQIRELEGLDSRTRAEQARVWRAERFAQTVLSIAPNFGFINIEDAQGKDLPLIFGVLESLRGNTALWSDDMQGTGIIAAAAMLGWADLTGRLDSRGGLGNVRGVIFGAGAGAMGVYEELINNGMEPQNILVADSQGALHAGRRDIEGDPYKLRMREGISEGMTAARFARGADFLINLGAKETFTEDPRWTQLV
ncbi:MAG TPA: hypothetical protein VJR29_06030, partial [bacterium]|nr:hypothetical protein [bacterium]